MTSRIDSFTDAQGQQHRERAARPADRPPPWGVFGAMVYMSLPLTIPLFAWRFDWSGHRFASETENR